MRLGEVPVYEAKEKYLSRREELGLDVSAAPPQTRPARAPPCGSGTSPSPRKRVPPRAASSPTSLGIQPTPDPDHGQQGHVKQLRPRVYSLPEASRRSSAGRAAHS